MPAYEHDCMQCGSFTALCPMSARNEPKFCPACGEAAPRVILTAPAITGMPAASRTAHATNERAANEPKTSSVHAQGCACCSGRRETDSTRAAGGLKTFPGRRPWMISH